VIGGVLVLFGHKFDVVRDIYFIGFEIALSDNGPIAGR
jgi:hypothetical protein